MKNVVLPMLRPGEEPILAGRLSGKRAFLAALETLPTMVEPTLVLLDFAGVALATSSFLSESILPLRDLLRLRGQPGYVVAANLKDEVREEMEEMLRRSGDALITCSVTTSGQIGDMQLCGKLEDKLHETLCLVSRKGETTAARLHKESRFADPVGATAWNNRLASLAAKSLVVEILQGRTKKYRPVLELLDGT
jgi:hypothetical protein